MADDAVETARAHLVRVVAQTHVGDPAWTIGEDRAELIVMRLEALFDAKASASSRVFPSAGQNNIIAMPARHALPEGFVPVTSVDQRGRLPEEFYYVIGTDKDGKPEVRAKHGEHVQVIYRDGKTRKPARLGVRPDAGEVAQFNWKHASAGSDGKMVGNPDDDIIGYRLVAPPENKMAMPKAVG